MPHSCSLLWTLYTTNIAESLPILVHAAQTQAASVNREPVNTRPSCQQLETAPAALCNRCLHRCSGAAGRNQRWREHAATRANLSSGQVAPGTLCTSRSAMSYDDAVQLHGIDSQVRRAPRPAYRCSASP